MKLIIDDDNSTFVRLVRVGKTVMMMSCKDDEEIVTKLFTFFGY